MEKAVMEAMTDLLSYIAHTEQTRSGVIERLQQNITTEQIKLAKEDNTWDRQLLSMLQAVLPLLQKPEENIVGESEMSIEMTTYDSGDTNNRNDPPVEVPWTERLSWGL